MLLKSFTRVFSSIRSLRSDDRGVALAAVLAFSAAGIILSTVIASTVVYAYGFSASTRSGIQSQASAEAGIAAARAGLINGTCVATGNGHYQSAAGAVPEYDAQVMVLSGGTWTNGCPLSASIDVKIVAVGTAETPGVGDDSGNEVTVEAILSSTASATAIMASGPAIYAYDATGFGGSGTLVSLDGSIADVLLKQGNVNCTGGSSGAAQLVIKTGNFTAGGSCVLAGNVWVSGNATLSGGAKIGGSVTAKAVTSSGEIGGNVWADDAANFSWGAKVAGWTTASTVAVDGGDLTGQVWARTGLGSISGGNVAGYFNAASFSGTGGTLSGGGGIHGAACVKTNLGLPSATPLKVKSLTTTSPCHNPATSSWWSGWSKVAVTPGYTAPASGSPSKPAAFPVPEWVDFGSSPDHYTSATWTGFTVYTMGATCGAAQFYAAIVAIGSNPGVIDARACTAGISFTGGSNDYASDPNPSHHGFVFQNDIAIIANKFVLKGSANFTSPTPHRMWLINPDTIANQTPDCGSRTMDIDGGFYWNNLDTMLYTPCATTIQSSTTLTGQLFAYRTTVEGGSHINYTPVGLPGYDLGSGLPTGTPTTEADRVVVSQRNVAP